MSRTDKPPDRFVIDFTEFAFLVEACIPPRPIARSMFWDNVINKYYPLLSKEERMLLYEWISRHPNFKPDEEDDCALFKARFDPDNQYEVTTMYRKKKEKVQCFLWQDRYCTDKKTSIDPKYIKDICKIT